MTEGAAARLKRYVPVLIGAALLCGAAVAGAAATRDRPKVEKSVTAMLSAPLEVLRPDPPKAPPLLQARLDEIARGYGEPVGIAVMDLEDGWIAAVDGDSLYPQQSVSKLWVAMTVLDAVDRKEMDLDEGVMLWPEDRSVFFQPITSRIGERGYPTTLRELIEHGLIESDNAANDKLISQLGGVEKVDAAIRAKDLGGVNIGADEKRLQSAVAGMEWREDLGVTSTFKAERAKLDPAIRDKALQDYLAAPPDGASPVGIVKALAALKRGELLSRESTSFMLATMSLARTGPRRLAGGLPEGWAIAHKTGTGQDWRGASAGINDVGLLTAPDGHVYAVAVMIRRTFQPVPVRLAMMQSVSRAVVETWSAGQPQTTIAGAPELSANTALAR